MTPGNTDLEQNLSREQKESKSQTSESSQPAGKTSARRRRSSRGKRKTHPAGQSSPPAPADTTPPDNWAPSLFRVSALEGKVRFHDFDLPGPLLHAIFDLGFEYCTPIQAEILPGTLSGKDASGRAQTGTGKTAAFLITVIDRLLKHPAKENRKPGTPRVLIIAPTRELYSRYQRRPDSLSSTVT